MKQMKQTQEDIIDISGEIKCYECGEKGWNIMRIQEKKSKALDSIRILEEKLHTLAELKAKVDKLKCKIEID